MKIKFFSIVLLLAIGCGDGLKYVHEVRIIKPDGKQYKAMIIESDQVLSTRLTPSGVDYVPGFYEQTKTPVGWRLEVTKKGIK